MIHWQTTNNTYAYRAYVETLLNYGEDTHSSLRDKNKPCENDEIGKGNFLPITLWTTLLHMDGQQQFLIPLKPDFTSSRFMSIFSATGNYQKGEGTDITRYDYPGGFALYCFDLSPDMAENDHNNLTKESSVRLEGRFSVVLRNTVNAVIYAEYENIIEID